MAETPQVWIACLAAYNAGCLHGKWVDATDADEMYEAAKEIIRTSPAWKLQGHAEEWAIHDYNNFPRRVVNELGEYPSFETVANVGRALEEVDDPDAFAAWLDVDEGASLESDTLEDDFRDHYRGEWESEERYAMDYVESCGWAGMAPVPDEMFNYLDWEMIASELFYHGNYTYKDGYVFESEV